MATGRRLSQVLLASHVGPVLLFGLLLLAIGVGTIRTAVIGEARTEAERAVSEARRRLQEWDRELNVGADLLAEQPTLRFYLARGQLTKARALVQKFHGTSDIQYIRVQAAGRLVAEFGLPPPTFAAGLSFDRNGSAWRIVQRDIPSLPGASLVVAEKLGDRLATRPPTDLITVAVQPLVLGLTPPGDPWAAALREVSISGEPDTYEDVGDNAAARIMVFRDVPSQSRVLISGRVATGWVQRRMIEWFAAFGLTALFTGGIALLLAVWLATRIARPFAQLSRDAARLGGGDLDTPVEAPTAFLAEPIALASSLDDMRRQIGKLTAAEREQRQELDALLDGVDEGIAGVDAAGRIHYANRQFLNLLGRNREELLGLPVTAVLRPVPVATGDEAAATGGMTALTRYAAIGVNRPLILRRLPASGDREILVVREENAAEAARAMRDRILANLSHEFQTPLSAQIASIELLRDHLRHGNDAIAIRLTDAQYRGTMRLSQLVDNLLESVRIESGEMRLRRQTVDLAAVVTDAVELIKPLTDQREQRIIASVAPGPSLTGDAQRPSSVMVNLLANANKFAPDQTTLWIDLEWQAECAVVWVEDEGPGLPATRAGNDLFAPFKRAPDDEPAQRGTGLGLAIVYAIVVAHGGQVRVAEPIRRHGARIGIVLPLDKAA